MHITLSADQEHFIQSQIRRGIFATPEEAIAAALRLLEGSSQDYEQWVKAVREQVAVGQSQLAAGERMPLEEAIAHLEQRLAQRREQGM